MPRHAPPQHTPPRHAPSRTAARHALVLREGSSGPAVRALQRRLAALQYYPGSTDGSFGNGTLEAVWAFQEVNHLPVSGDVGSATHWALAHPRAYRARYPRQDGTLVEVNLGMGVLAFFRHGRIALISHVSSGGHYYFPCSGGGTCYAETPTGEFHALYFVPGWDQGPLGAMYNPVFFNYNGYAIHGDSSVPANPVSHGCVRIPMDVAAWFHRELHVNEAPGHGTQVWIYNQW
jgi:peptidoglycan hydrolase-like protein with peptidoglycan-binding domain